MIWCIAMSEFNVDRDDVIELTDSNVGGAEIFTTRRLIAALQAVSQPMITWLRPSYEDKDSIIYGVNCRCLKPGNPNGWEVGKIRLRLEFIPEKPPERQPESEQ